MSKLRACKVGDKEGMFHMWEQYSDVVDASPLMGGHPAGTFSQVFGIVEFENGEVKRVQPYEIKFLDNYVKESGALKISELTDIAINEIKKRALETGISPLAI